jgi:signal peptidase I
MRHHLKTLLTAIVVIAGFALFAIQVAYPFITSTETAWVRTGSMQPTLPTGSYVYIDRHQPYQVGDIVAFRANGQTIIHRLVAEWTGDNRTGPFATQGDANNGRDADLVTRQQIIGKAVAYIPWVGWATSFLALPWVAAFLLILALTFIAWPALTAQEPASQPA